MRGAWPNCPCAHGDALSPDQTGSGRRPSSARISRLWIAYEPQDVADYAHGRHARRRTNQPRRRSEHRQTNAGNEVTASYVPPADVVAEFKVQTASFDAGLGRPRAA